MLGSRVASLCRQGATGLQQYDLAALGKTIQRPSPGSCCRPVGQTIALCKGESMSIVRAQIVVLLGNCLCICWILCPRPIWIKILYAIGSLQIGCARTIDSLAARADPSELTGPSLLNKGLKRGPGGRSSVRLCFSPFYQTWDPPPPPPPH